MSSSTALIRQWRACVLCLGFLLCLWIPASHAVIVENLYQASVPVAGSGEEQQTQALAEALKQVAVKVSGQTAAAEHAAVLEAAKSAKQWVVQFGYTGDAGAERSLQVSFVPSAIDRMLGEAGLPVWGSNRPALVTWLAIERNGQRDLLGSEAYGELAGVLEKRARERGVPLVIPLMDLEDSGNVSVADVWQLSQEPVQRASSRYRHDAVLLGKIFEQSGQWQAEWQLQSQGDVFADQVSGGSVEAVLQALVDSLAQRMAARYAVASQGAGDAATVELEVTSVDSVQDYATLSRYLSTLAPVSSAQPAQVEGDRIRFRLQLKGPIDQVHEYLALERRLQRLPDPPRAEAPASQTPVAPVQVPEPPVTVPTLHYRWQP